MKARHRELAIDLAPEPRLRFILENNSEEELRSQDVVFSYQVLDVRSGKHLVEGDRMVLPGDLKPGEATSLELSVGIPEKPGRYRLCASLLREHRAWAYELGLPFIDATFERTRDGGIRVERVEEIIGVRQPPANLLRRLLRAFFYPLRSAWVNRSLSYSLVRREILSRSRGSLGGSLWTILSPLLLMLTYFFVFGLVLKARFGNDPSPASFALYFLAGMLPWLAFSEAVTRAPVVLFEYRTVIKKLVFPIEILPVNLVYTGLVGEAFGAALFTIAFLLIRHHLPWSVLYLPLILIPQILFTVAMCWFLSALGVFLRDLAQINGFLITIWFFVTPICYPESQIPSGARWILEKNPLYVIVQAYRLIFLEGRAPDWRSLGILTAVSIVFTIAAHAWFYKLRKWFADIL